MRQFSLPVLAAMSLAVGAILASGYVLDLGLLSYRHRLGPPAAFARLMAYVDAGRVSLFVDNWTPQSVARISPVPTGVHLKGSVRAGGRWRDLKSGVYECRANWNGGPYWRATVFFPIWFAEVPCLIAPLLWLRRWRAQRGTALPGFAVVGTSGEA